MVQKSIRGTIIAGFRLLANMLNVRINCIGTRGRMHRGTHKRMKRHEWVNIGRAERRRGKWSEQGFHRGRYLDEEMWTKTAAKISAVAAWESDSQCKM